jgi:hypothetical protein
MSPYDGSVAGAQIRACGQSMPDLRPSSYRAGFQLYIANHGLSV